MTAAVRKPVLVEPPPEGPSPDAAGGVVAPDEKKRAAAAERKRRHDQRKAAGLYLAKPEIPMKLLGEAFELGLIGAECLPDSPGFDRSALNAKVVDLLKLLIAHKRAEERERSKRGLAGR